MGKEGVFKLSLAVAKEKINRERFLAPQLMLEEIQNEVIPL